MTDEVLEVWSANEDGSASVQCTRCSACGATLFPPQSYGCTRCGAFGDALSRVGIAAKGTLLTFAVVRTHDRHRVPFTLGDVELDGGPIVRAQLGTDVEPRIGGRLSGRVVDDADGLRLEFTAEASE